jgi:DNA polymerase-3 subunit beta
VKISVQASALASALATVAVRSKRPVVRVVAADGTITVTCADSHIAITATATATVLESGQVAVAYDRLSSLASGFAGGATVMIDTTDSNMATITCSNSRSRLQTIPIDDLPNVITIGDGATAQIDIGGVDDLLTLLEPNSVAPSEQTRFMLCGVFWHNVGDRLVAAATDGHQLIRVGVPVADTLSITRDMIVPRDSAITLQRLIKQRKPGRVTLRRSRMLFAVIAPGLTFTSRLIDGVFPNYELVVPEPAPNIVTCDRHALLASISRLRAVATVEPQLVALYWSGARFDIYLARERETGADSIAAKCNGAAQVAIPLGQLVGMINEFQDDRLCLETSEGKPLLMRGEGDKLGLISRSTWNFGAEAETARVRPPGRDAEYVERKTSNRE